MRSVVVFLVGIVMASATLVFPAAVRADAMKVVGGGVASFDNVARLSSYFGVLATIQDDGTTAGEFTSMIVDRYVLIGNLTNATKNDDGSIRLEGVLTAIRLQAGDVVDDVPFSIVIWQGGPKVGRLLYHDANQPDPGDYQTVFLGGIQIR
jgi:hypothetical protein